MKWWLLLAVFSFSSLFAFEKSVVKIYTRKSHYNYLHPWQSPSQGECTGSGFVSEDGSIVTNAHVVGDSIFLQVKLSNDPRRFLARVEAIGHDCDLAILKIDDPLFASLAQKLKWARHMPKLRDPIIACGYPAGGEHLAITQGNIVRFEIGPYVHQGYNLMKCQLDALISPGSSGGPVLLAESGEVVGVVHQGGYQAEMIPLNIISHFVTGAREKNYQGFFSPGVRTSSMENSALRRYFKMRPEESGVLVTDVMESSPARGILEKSDVIVGINNNPVFNDGTYKYNEGQYLNISHLFSSAQEGTRLKIDLIRNGEPLTQYFEVDYSSGYKALVPPMEYDKPPTYFIFGGLVFQPLTHNYVQDLLGYGCKLDALSDILFKLENGERENSESEVVLLSSVLSDESNLGYHYVRRWIVEAVNGKEVNSLKDVVRLIEENTDPYLIIRNDRGQELILDYNESKNAHGHIMKTHQIADDRSADLR